jgi:hypothetical protein
MRFLIVFFVFAFSFACSVQSDIPTNDLSLLFDINSYFDKYLEDLPEDLTVKKRVQVGSEFEEKILEHYKFRKDLDFFRKADIYDPVFLDKYVIDSSVSGVMKYIAREDDLSVLSLQVFRSNNQIDSILATTQIKSMISDQLNHLHFIPSVSYSIFTMEDAIFKEPVERMIRVEFQ